MKTLTTPVTQRTHSALRILQKVEAESLLNVGMRHPGSQKNWWWVDLCKLNGTSPLCLEAWPENVKQLRAAGVPNVTEGSVADVEKLYDAVDVILWWHGPEHMDREDATEAIRACERVARKLVLLGCPWGKDPQGAVDGNPHEVHRSYWQPSDFAELGYEYETLWDQPAPGHITAWKFLESQE